MTTLQVELNGPLPNTCLFGLAHVSLEDHPTKKKRSVPPIYKPWSSAIDSRGPTTPPILRGLSNQRSEMVGPKHVTPSTGFPSRQVCLEVMIIPNLAIHLQTADERKAPNIFPPPQLVGKVGNAWGLGVKTIYIWHMGWAPTKVGPEKKLEMELYKNPSTWTETNE